MRWSAIIPNRLPILTVMKMMAVPGALVRARESSNSNPHPHPKIKAARRHRSKILAQPRTRSSNRRRFPRLRHSLQGGIEHLQRELPTPQSEFPARVLGVTEKDHTDRTGVRQRILTTVTTTPALEIPTPTIGLTGRDKNRERSRQRKVLAQILIDSQALFRITKALF
jgi:hypothetical protein